MTTEDLAELINLLASNLDDPRFTRQEYEATIKKDLIDASQYFFDIGKLYGVAFFGGYLDKFDMYFYKDVVILNEEIGLQKRNPDPKESNIRTWILHLKK